jgi:hypothetical protein|uniref:Transmembrane protein n=1 Tax=virus sp. ctDJ83 TaxID=2827625 RepID=A0A8S5RJN2_9VIRU|nr:MAG TPA: hypothetical protein [virus sp. ctDJ83]
MEANSTSPYQNLRIWGYVFSIGLTLVCLIAFLCTCATKFPILDDDGIIVSTRIVFNPLSLVYLFSCIPTLAFGSLFSAVARIGENVQAMKDAKGGELSEESRETDGTEVDTQKNENRSILYALVGATIILAVVFTLAFWVFK